MITKINLPGLELDNPIIPASGTFGFGHEFMQFYDINILGSISLKGSTIESRYGNPLPRIAECESGMINAIGLQNPGVEKVINEELVKLKKVYHKKVIANVAGSTIEDYIQCAQAFDKEEMIGALEINVSCPNVKCGGIAFGTDPKMLYKLAKKIKESVSKPVYIKLSPNVTNIVELALACERANVDGLVMINTLIGMKIDLNTKKPVIHNKMGGFSGPAIKPVAIRMIYQVAQATKLPIIGCGGVKNAYDVIEMMLAGASAVQVGSENLINPYACQDIILELEKVMKELKIDDLNDIIKGALNE
ncbi:dihydroorotate dehydrogenase [Mycoplasma sp. P36-A1]|uniref:dihydroorotate dehydrogenase n=1 Tax=Mycoplasma sp. P36-A1 TaxID=3252900 RepID=UPI003C2F1CD8